MSLEIVQIMGKWVDHGKVPKVVLFERRHNSHHQWLIIVSYRDLRVLIWYIGFMFSEHILYVAHIRVKNCKVTCTLVFHIQQAIILNTTTQLVIRLRDHFGMGNKFITQLTCWSLHRSMINDQTHILHISSTLWVEATCFPRNFFYAA